MDNPFRPSAFGGNPQRNATNGVTSTSVGVYDAAASIQSGTPAVPHSGLHPPAVPWNGAAEEQQQFPVSVRVHGVAVGEEHDSVAPPPPFASQAPGPMAEEPEEDDDQGGEEDIDVDDDEDISEQDEEEVEDGDQSATPEQEPLGALRSDQIATNEAPPSTMDVDMREEASRMEEEMDEEGDDDSHADRNASENSQFATQLNEELQDSALQNEPDGLTVIVKPAAIPAPVSNSPESKRNDANATAPSPSSPTRKVRGKVLRLKKRPPTLKRLLSDSISVQIPLSVTADLGIAVKRTREKRVAAFYKRFPELQAAEKKEDAEDQEAVDEDGEGGTAKVEKRDKRPKLSHVPQRNEYASIMDYLEAKYVQGVMIGDEAGDDEEGQGSVYSETSFLDDSGLQRTVAEQVMGQATTTKLELQEDDAFFVNVGELEVEESELTKQNYDPLQDLKNDAKKSRKRKKPPSEAKQNGSGAKKPPPKQSQKKKAAPKQEEPAKKKTKTKPASDKKTPKSPTKVDQTKPAEKPQPKSDDPATENLRLAAMKLQLKTDELLEEMIQEVQGFNADQLPAREKAAKIRVVISVPEGKKAGDVIKFANPHNKAQKVQTKIPAGTGPGDSFKVLVSKPAPEPAESDNADHNNIPREFYGLLDEFARSFDEWSDAEGVYRKAIKDKDFSAHLTKRTKFDNLIPTFPTGLKTPVDKAYLQRILRRARQSKQKRAQTVARQHQPSEPTSITKKELTIAFKPTVDKADAPGIDASSDNASVAETNETGQGQQPLWMNALPKTTIRFGTKQFDRSLFEVET